MAVIRVMFETNDPMTFWRAITTLQALDLAKPLVIEIAGTLPGMNKPPTARANGHDAPKPERKRRGRRSRVLAYRKGDHGRSIIDVPASLKSLKLSEQQLLGGHWRVGTPQHRLFKAVQRRRFVTQSAKP
jgi:hypothetical protein